MANIHIYSDEKNNEFVIEKRIRICCFGVDEELEQKFQSVCLSSLKVSSACGSGRTRLGSASI